LNINNQQKEKKTMPNKPHYFKVNSDKSITVFLFSDFNENNLYEKHHIPVKRQYTHFEKFLKVRDDQTSVFTPNNSRWIFKISSETIIIIDNNGNETDTLIELESHEYVDYFISPEKHKNRILHIKEE
jgi:hypothetical protein